MKVLFFPFFGAKKYQIEKYVHFWQELGSSEIDIVEYTTNEIIISAFTDRPIGKRIVSKNIEQLNHKQYDIVFCMSVGIFIFYLSGLYKQLSYKLIILDSFVFKQTTKAMLDIIRHISKLYYVLYPLITIIMIRIYTLDIIKCINQSSVSTLFLIGLNDIANKSIKKEEMIDLVTNKNHSLVFFKDAGHVKIFKKYPIEYKQTIQSFINSKL